MKRSHRILALLAPLFALGGAVAWFTVGSVPPSDESVLSHFRRAEPHLENLRQMLDADVGVELVASYGVTTDNSIVSKPPTEVGMAEIRFQKYLEELGLAKANSAFHRDNEYKFGIGGWGFTTHGWRLAFVYRNVPPPTEEMISTLDGFGGPTGHEWREGYRHLEGKWYAWIIW